MRALQADLVRTPAGWAPLAMRDGSARRGFHTNVTSNPEGLPNIGQYKVQLGKGMSDALSIACIYLTE